MNNRGGDMTYDYDDYNDYNEYNEYNDYNDCNEYNDYDDNMGWRNNMGNNMGNNMRNNMRNNMANNMGNNMGYNDMGPPMRMRPNENSGGSFGKFRNERYNNAYGNYRGGYGPGNGYGPPNRFMGPDSGPGPNFFSEQPQQQQFMWGRGFGPDGPPVRKQPVDDKALRYLMRCGVTKDNLKNLPKELLQLIKPNGCGLCGHNFETFTISRMHYISKNHLKNQKKWISQHSQMGYQRAREIPLKSRDLYCELCDVHITSKTHADSHYSGKIHRSVVEGRKMPKNPFLLQKGMESRVDQLVRREKKHLKPVEETEEVVENFKDGKPIQPELYCEICKTSVTCTEQMTMHLNGKRHLSKEKQHILKMMKGDDNGADKVDDSAAGGEEDEECDEGEDEEDKDGEEKDKEAQDSFDWGNGSGAWEETAENE